VLRQFKGGKLINCMWRRQVSVIARNGSNYQVEITNGRHQFLTDEPLGVGDDLGPTAYEFLLSALAACKIVTVQLYAQRKGWPLQDVRVKMDIKKVHARDCEDCASDPNARVDLIECLIEFEGQLTPEQIDRLTQISERCPVHRTLTSETVIRTQVGEVL
jgi:putative redox protein